MVVRSTSIPGRPGNPVQGEVQGTSVRPTNSTAQTGTTNTFRPTNAIIDNVLSVVLEHTGQFFTTTSVGNNLDLCACQQPLCVTVNAKNYRSALNEVAAGTTDLHRASKQVGPDNNCTWSYAMWHVPAGFAAAVRGCTSKVSAEEQCAMWVYSYIQLQSVPALASPAPLAVAEKVVVPPGTTSARPTPSRPTVRALPFHKRVHPSGKSAYAVGLPPTFEYKVHLGDPTWSNTVGSQGQASAMFIPDFITGFAPPSYLCRPLFNVFEAAPYGWFSSWGEQSDPTGSLGVVIDYSAIEDPNNFVDIILYKTDQNATAYFQQAYDPLIDDTPFGSHYLGYAFAPNTSSVYLFGQTDTMAVVVGRLTANNRRWSATIERTRAVDFPLELAVIERTYTGLVFAATFSRISVTTGSAYLAKATDETWVNLVAVSGVPIGGGQLPVTGTIYANSNIVSVGGNLVTTTVPVSGVVTPGVGTQNVNVVQVGGNIVSTTVPVSGAVTVSNIPAVNLTQVAGNPVSTQGTSGVIGIDIKRTGGAPVGPSNYVPVAVQTFGTIPISGPTLPIYGAVDANLTMVAGDGIGPKTPGQAASVPIGFTSPGGTTPVSAANLLPVTGGGGGGGGDVNITRVGGVLIGASVPVAPTVVVDVNIKQVDSENITNPLPVAAGGGGGLATHVIIDGGIKSPDYPVWVADVRFATDNGAEQAAARRHNHDMMREQGNDTRGRFFDAWEAYCSANYDPASAGNPYLALALKKTEDAAFSELVWELADQEFSGSVTRFLRSAAELEVEVPQKIKERLSASPPQLDGTKLGRRGGGTGAARAGAPEGGPTSAKNDPLVPARRICKRLSTVDDLVDWLMWVCDDVNGFGWLVMDNWFKEHTDQRASVQHSVAQCMTTKTSVRATVGAVLAGSKPMSILCVIQDQAMARWMDHHFPARAVSCAHRDHVAAAIDIPTASDADEAAARAHNHKMMREQGNDLSLLLPFDGVSLGWLQAVARGWNRLQHSLNGNTTSWPKNNADIAALPSISTLISTAGDATNPKTKLGLLAQLSGIVNLQAPISAGVTAQTLMRSPYTQQNSATTANVSEPIPMTIAQPIQCRSDVAPHNVVQTGTDLMVMDTVQITIPPVAAPEKSSIITAIETIVSHGGALRADAQSPLNFYLQDCNNMAGLMPCTSGTALIAGFTKLFGIMDCIAGAAGPGTMPMLNITFADNATTPMGTPVAVTLNTSAYPLLNCLTGQANPLHVFPLRSNPAAATGGCLTRFHASSRTIGSARVPVAIQVQMGLFLDTAHPELIYPLVVAMFAKGPIGLFNWVVSTQNELGANVQDQEFMPWASLIGIDGEDVIDILCQLDAGVGLPPRNQGDANDAPLIQPAWGPYPPPYVAGGAYEAIDVNYVGGPVGGVSTADWLCSWFDPRGGGIKVATIMRFIDLVAGKCGRNGDVSVARDLVDMMSVRAPLLAADAIGENERMYLGLDLDAQLVQSWNGQVCERFPFAQVGVRTPTNRTLMLPRMPQAYWSLVMMGLCVVIDDGLVNLTAEYHSPDYVNVAALMGGVRAMMVGDAFHRNIRQPVSMLNVAVSNPVFTKMAVQARSAFLERFEENSPIVAKHTTSWHKVYSNLFSGTPLSAGCGMSAFSSWLISGLDSFSGPLVPGGMATYIDTPPMICPDWMFQMLTTKYFKELNWQVAGLSSDMVGKKVNMGQYIQLSGNQLSTLVPTNQLASTLGIQSYAQQDPDARWNDIVLWALSPYLVWGLTRRTMSGALLNAPGQDTVVCARRHVAGPLIPFSLDTQNLIASSNSCPVVTTRGEYVFTAIATLIAPAMTRFLAQVNPQPGFAWQVRGALAVPELIFVGGSDSHDVFASTVARADATDTAQNERVAIAKGQPADVPPPGTGGGAPQ